MTPDTSITIAEAAREMDTAIASIIESTSIQKALRRIDGITLLTVAGTYAIVPLSRGKKAIVDLDCVPLVSGFNWSAMGPSRNGRFYAYRRDWNAGRAILMHRHILGITGKLFVDHRNRDGLDNRKSNLRPATNTQNLANQGPRSGASSRFKGVSFDSSRGKWCANVHCENKHFRLGRFSTEEAAARAYDEKAVELFGEFALTNFGSEQP
jgi:hypothetical protein